MPSSSLSTSVGSHKPLKYKVAREYNPLPIYIPLSGKAFVGKFKGGEINTPLLLKIPISSPSVNPSPSVSGLFGSV